MNLDFSVASKFQEQMTKIPRKNEENWVSSDKKKKTPVIIIFP